MRRLGRGIGVGKLRQHDVPRTVSFDRVRGRHRRDIGQDAGEQHACFELLYVRSDGVVLSGGRLGRTGYCTGLSGERNDKADNHHLRRMVTSLIHDQGVELFTPRRGVKEMTGSRGVSNRCSRGGHHRVRQGGDIANFAECAKTNFTGPTTPGRDRLSRLMVPAKCPHFLASAVAPEFDISGILA